MDGQGQALAQAQAAGVDELDGRAIAAQADMRVQPRIKLRAWERCGGEETWGRWGEEPKLTRLD